VLIYYAELLIYFYRHVAVLTPFNPHHASALVCAYTRTPDILSNRSDWNALSSDPVVAFSEMQKLTSSLRRVIPLYVRIDRIGAGRMSENQSRRPLYRDPNPQLAFIVTNADCR
jgi:hypothetical protein